MIGKNLPLKGVRGWGSGVGDQGFEDIKLDFNAEAQSVDKDEG